MPRLENWSIRVSNPFQAPELQSKRLHGLIFDDENNRFKDGTIVSTSSIQELNLKEGYALTRNTKYTLGEPDEKYIKWLKKYKNTLDTVYRNMVIYMSRVERRTK